ncbi:MAG TPA: AgmX/PglI C-terminal domain-containing protein, partial [Polyangiaceae bacterium]|nr:AgmX/PglI C-terminal domain-containing protein [Polyangiaceae bacterium]
AGGNVVEARVFPIAAHERKQIIVAYSEPLLEHTGHVLPLSGLPVLDRLSVRIYDGASPKPTAEFERANYAPDAELRTVLRASAGARVVRAQNLAVMRFTPVNDEKPEALGPTLVLVDTSASQAQSLRRTSERLGDVFRALAQDGDERIIVAAFDQEVQILHEGTLSSAAGVVGSLLRDRRALGASNLSAALGAATERARKSAIRRVLFVTDGLATAGEREPAALRSMTRATREAGLERIDVISPAGRARETKILAELVSAGLPKAGAVIDDGAGAEAIARKLRSRVAGDLRVDIEGASFVWPQVVRSAQAGDEVVVAAELPANRAVRLTVGGRAIELPAPRTGTAALLKRYVAEARIDALLELEALEGRRGELERRIIELSRQERVLSPYTSLLVLETDADYARFGIARRAPGAYLGVRDGRLALGDSPTLNAATPDRQSRLAVENKDAQANEAPQDASRADPPQTSAIGRMWGDEIGESFGAGGLGLSGTGEGGGGEGVTFGMVGSTNPTDGVGVGQGFGAGHGRLGGSHATSAPKIRSGTAAVSGRLPPEVIQRIVRQSFGRFRLCYERALAADPNLQGNTVVRFVIGRSGTVEGVVRLAPSLGSHTLDSCISSAFMGLAFPEPEGGKVIVAYPLQLGGGPAATKSAPALAEPPAALEPPLAAAERQRSPESPPAAATYSGRMGEITALLEQRRAPEALNQALEWTSRAPNETLAYVALGKVYAKLERPRDAARAYGSIIDLFSARADMRRYSSNLLESLPERDGLDLAIDSYRVARSDRPDHPSGQRSLALALARRNRYGEAFDVLLATLARGIQNDRFGGVEHILRDDLALIGALWEAHEPAARQAVHDRLAAAGLEPAHEASLRLVLTWETDANDVDFHIYDAAGNHAFYGNRRLPGGGELYADVTTGYGPECFNIPLTSRAKPSEYRLQAHYYARGPMGYGMGKLEIIEFDGHGSARFEERPYLVMEDRAYADLGSVRVGGERK